MLIISAMHFTLKLAELNIYMILRVSHKSFYTLRFPWVVLVAYMLNMNDLSIYLSSIYLIISLWWLILCINLMGIRDIQLDAETLLLGVSVRVFLEEISTSSLLTPVALGFLGLQTWTELCHWISWFLSTWKADCRILGFLTVWANFYNKYPHMCLNIFAIGFVSLEVTD